MNDFSECIDFLRTNNMIQKNELIDVISHRLSDIGCENISLINKALDDASIFHISQKRADGQSYIVHPLRVALIYSFIADTNCADFGYGIIASFLHDVVEDSNVTFEYISNTYGSEVASIINQLSTRKEEISETVAERKIRKTSKWSTLQNADANILAVHAGDVCDNAISWRNLPVTNSSKIPRWMYQVKEYQIPLFKKHFPKVVSMLQEEITFQENRGYPIGRWEDI